MIVKIKVASTITLFSFSFSVIFAFLVFNANNIKNKRVGQNRIQSSRQHRKNKHTGEINMSVFKNRILKRCTLQI